MVLCLLKFLYFVFLPNNIKRYKTRTPKKHFQSSQNFKFSHAKHLKFFTFNNFKKKVKKNDILLKSRYGEMVDT